MVLDVLYNKWGSDGVVTGENQPETPPLAGFINTIPALEMLNHHLTKRSKIAVHCDVDMDGIGTGYIVKQFIGGLTTTPQLYVINTDKIHGVQEKHNRFFSINPVDLLIIVDSSSSDIDIIKNFNCDVLVVDHHNVAHSEFIGNTVDGHKFVIVNNTISNNNAQEITNWLGGKSTAKLNPIQPYEADSHMSCGLVIYELFRIYELGYMTGTILENKMLYQWAGVTLFTDAIYLNTPRNQWYINKTIHTTDVEPTLMSLITNLSKWNTKLTKSVIGYSLAPTINRAIRAGASAEALNVVMSEPGRVGELQRYRDIQDASIASGVAGAREQGSYVHCDITNLGIHRNYCGVIAGKLVDLYGKNAITYIVDGGLAEGSFRGRDNQARYLDHFSSKAWAQGHDTAFGFKAPVTQLDDIMNGMTMLENTRGTRPYFTAGSMPEHSKGEYHLDDLVEFKKEGGLWRLSLGNSSVSSDEQIVITIHSSNISLKEVVGKLYIYDVLGMECKAFSEVQSEYVNVYAEFGKTIELYIK